MDMWSSSDAWYCSSKSNEGNSRRLQIGHKGSAFLAVRVNTDINGIAMIPTHSIMSCALTECANW